MRKISCSATGTELGLTVTRAPRSKIERESEREDEFEDVWTGLRSASGLHEPPGT